MYADMFTPPGAVGKVMLDPEVAAQSSTSFAKSAWKQDEATYWALMD